MTGNRATPLRAPANSDNSRVPDLRAAAKAMKAPRGQALPVESTPSAAAQVNGLFKSYAPLAYMLPWEILDYIEILATYNPDYSQAVDNIRTLANSGHELFVDSSSPRAVDRLKDRIEEKARTIQEPHGGVDGLIDKLLDQGATFGAMCGEWIINEEMDDVVEFVDINPKTIRYSYDRTRKIWMPYQKVSSDEFAKAKERGQAVMGTDLIQLNPATFKYFAFDAAPGSPYGTPPFVAALANIAIQRDMVHNMSQIVKKIGLLGIVDITVQSLKQQPNESNEEYLTRATGFLDEYATVMEEMVRDGGIVHFDDVQVQTTALGGNAAGATNIFKQNEELIFSGLKSMPSVQGRSYSTTETYAGVAYDIIIRNTRKYQRACKRMIENGYWLMATMWGETPKKIAVSFNENKTLHRVQDAQAEALEIKNALALWATGVIDQHGYAQRLGYSSVKTEYPEPPASEIIGNAAKGSLTSGDDGGDPDEDRSDSQDTRSDD